MKHLLSMSHSSFLSKRVLNVIFKILFLSSMVYTTSLYAETVSQSDSTEDQPKQYYIVEVILFRHLNEQGKNNEYWNSIATSSDENNFSVTTSALAQYDLNNKHFSPLQNGISALSAEHYQLLDSAAHIKYSKDFQLLAHFGWAQESLSRKSALPVLISSDNYANNLLPNGELTLYVSRFLHMEVDLSASDCRYPDKAIYSQISDEQLDKQLAEGTSQLDKNGVQLDNKFTKCINNTYQFLQNRKMRSKELHYIDNPLFGLLVYITPFTKDGG